MMKILANTLIPAGMILACACGASHQATTAEPLNPPPAFASYEPTRAPIEDYLAGRGGALTAANNVSAPASPMRIVAGPQPEEPQALQPVYFEFGSAFIESENRDRLAEYAAWLKAHPEQQVLIEGHTDVVGPSEYNYELGELRALAVRDFLIQLGVDENRMQVVSRGEERPVSQDQDALNRRSDIVPVPNSLSMQQ